MDHYLQTLYDKHLAKVLEDAGRSEPVDPEVDKDNPHMQFWALIRMGAELDTQITRNDAYYASGRCGGCETCGLPPFPEVPYDVGQQFKAMMRDVMARMEEAAHG